jgi:hypothetical protein
MITNPNAPAVDLVNDGIHHAVRRAQFHKIATLR